ncbi:MAG: hypothetical protein Q8W44_08690 [Candidatus Palauibacterales bacterium]|nr:hypothetical protein [Candidatus Palauibacterales bacterium]
MVMEGINGQRPIPNVPPGDSGSGGQSGAERADRPEDADAPRRQDPSSREDGQATRRSSVKEVGNGLPAEAPDDIDSRIWQAMDADERKHFAQMQDLEGPLTYGPDGPDGSDSEEGVRRGLHLDVRA